MGKLKQLRELPFVHLRGALPFHFFFKITGTNAKLICGTNLLHKLTLKIPNGIFRLRNRLLRLLFLPLKPAADLFNPHLLHRFPFGFLPRLFPFLPFGGVRFERKGDGLRKNLRDHLEFPSFLRARCKVPELYPHAFR